MLLSQSTPISFGVVPGIPPIGLRLKITRFDAHPLAFEDTGQNFGNINVNVKNFGLAEADVTITLEVLDPLTNEPVLGAVNASTSCSNVAAGGECPFDGTGLDISLLPRGSYKLSATTWITGEPLLIHDNKSLFFSIGRPAIVPDLGLFLVPLIAFSVLTVVFLAGKKQV